MVANSHLCYESPTQDTSARFKCGNRISSVQYYALVALAVRSAAASLIPYAVKASANGRKK